MTGWVFAAACWIGTPLLAQQESVRPGINDSFRDPDPQKFAARFEVESREVFAKRVEIVAELGLKPGMVIADVGAGTGLFTREFAAKLGRDGRVLAVDISKNFLEHIRRTTREKGLLNVETVLCSDDSTKLPQDSVDAVFICDTYHHFEYPAKTMTSVRKALKPGGKVYVIDFHRIEGKSSEWTMNHVRAGQEVFEAEILEAGFRRVRQVEGVLSDNYMLVFEVAVKDQQR
ncbi:MAG: class I SAM-dependent methyltransferase [Planctomycetaceae bacterium]|jgi:cyclopropane fatty-acyl-phospholipid synthase-like methyltransferase